MIFFIQIGNTTAYLIGSNGNDLVESIHDCFSLFCVVITQKLRLGTLQKKEVYLAQILVAEI
jgi:hypothetical protein